MEKNEYLIEVSVLHKYWIWSNMMKVKFFEQLSESEEIENFQIFLLSELGVYMMYWYSSLYVVVEGYKDSR